MIQMKDHIQRLALGSIRQRRIKVQNPICEFCSAMFFE